MRPKSNTPCSATDCDRPVYGYGLCNMHYQQWRRSPEGQAFREANATPEQRFWVRIEKTEACWLYTGPLSKTGYGYFSIVGDPILAHHYLVGKPPKGLEWDHLCKVRNCVRPDHLELVTRQQNVARQDHWRGQRKERVPCSQSGCDRPSKGLGLCWRHYMQDYRRKHGPRGSAQAQSR